MAITIKKNELRLTDTLNFDVFKNLTENNRKEMVKHRTQAILNSEVINMFNNTRHLEIPIGDEKEYNVTGVFTILDWQMNKRGALTASMLCKRNGKNMDVVVKNVTYKLFQS